MVSCPRKSARTAVRAKAAPTAVARTAPLPTHPAVTAAKTPLAEALDAVAAHAVLPAGKAAAGECASLTDIQAKAFATIYIPAEAMAAWKAAVAPQADRTHELAAICDAIDGELWLWLESLGVAGVLTRARVARMQCARSVLAAFPRAAGSPELHMLLTKFWCSGYVMDDGLEAMVADESGPEAKAGHALITLLFAEAAAGNLAPLEAARDAWAMAALAHMSGAADSGSEAWQRSSLAFVDLLLEVDRVSRMRAGGALSSAWRCEMFAIMRDFVSGVAVEARWAAQRAAGARVAAADYLSGRVLSAGLLPAFVLVELVWGSELPASVWGSDAYAEVMALAAVMGAIHNDLLSLARDLHEEAGRAAAGRASNGSTLSLPGLLLEALVPAPLCSAASVVVPEPALHVALGACAAAQHRVAAYMADAVCRLEAEGGAAAAAWAERLWVVLVGITQAMMPSPRYRVAATPCA